MSATADPRHGFASLAPRVVPRLSDVAASRADAFGQFAVTGDGQRFLVFGSEAMPDATPQVIVNWFETLARKAAGN